MYVHVYIKMCKHMVAFFIREVLRTSIHGKQLLFSPFIQTYGVGTFGSDLDTIQV